jgi:NAD(P)-dependent dehydrogenase (short-subunit alcohol dehydrogenase family)
VQLAEDGWNVAFTFLRDRDAAGEVEARLRKSGAEVLALMSDVTQPDDRAEFLTALVERTGAVGGIVHAAALGAPSTALGMRPGRWRMTWDSHVGGFLDLISLLRPMLRPHSSIVALSSAGAHRVLPGYAPIGASKAALEAFVRYLAVELEPEGIRVNAVSAGPVVTRSLRSFPFYEELEAEARRRPPGRLGRPEDVAPVIAFLLGPDSAWIRGQILVADGGFGLL